MAARDQGNVAARGVSDIHEGGGRRIMAVVGRAGEDDDYDGGEDMPV